MVQRSSDTLGLRWAVTDAAASTLGGDAMLLGLGKHIWPER